MLSQFNLKLAASRPSLDRNCTWYGRVSLAPSLQLQASAPCEGKAAASARGLSLPAQKTGADASRPGESSRQSAAPEPTPGRTNGGKLPARAPGLPKQRAGRTSGPSSGPGRGFRDCESAPDDSDESVLDRHGGADTLSWQSERNAGSTEGSGAASFVLSAHRMRFAATCETVPIRSRDSATD